jgi:hypothetical protein
LMHSHPSQSLKHSMHDTHAVIKPANPPAISAKGIVNV